MVKKIDPSIQPISETYNSFLGDESRISGHAESISFPKNEADVQRIVKSLLAEKTPITIQGSRTGITGAAVPIKGHLLNLSKMTNIVGMKVDKKGQFSICAQPGVLLEDLNRHLETCRFETKSWKKNDLEVLETFKKAKQQFWPPDPTEKSATIGGIAANNSRGICAYHYGSASRYISSLRLVDMKGDLQVFERDSDDSLFGLDFKSDSPVHWKDLLFGSEGMLGIITELTLSLEPLPNELWSIVFFFEFQSEAVKYIASINSQENKEVSAKIVAIEIMDQTTLECIQDFKQTTSQLQELPIIEPHLTTAVYLEIHGNNEHEVEQLCEKLMEKASDNNGDPDCTWAFSGEHEIERLHLFRHAAPEAVNFIIDQIRQKDSRITKLATDMCPQTNMSLKELLEMYDQDLKTDGLRAAIFGHAGDAHLHVNILPEDYTQFKVGKRCIQNWAKKIANKGGSVVKEHGVGKIKKSLFRSIPLPERLQKIQNIKRKLDPNELWNPGNMFE